MERRSGKAQLCSHRRGRKRRRKSNDVELANIPGTVEVLKYREELLNYNYGMV